MGTRLSLYDVLRFFWYFVWQLVRCNDCNDYKYVKVNSVNPLYLIFSKVNGYFKEISKSKDLTLVPTNKSKEKI